MSSALDTNPNQKPIGLFFEVLPKIGHRKAYFEYVNKLQPALAENDGLLWLKRYEEIKNKKLILSHQLWKDERSIKKWRKNNLHIIAQDAGKRIHFLDYRIRVGPCFWRWDKQDKIKSSNSIPFKAPFLLTLHIENETIEEKYLRPNKKKTIFRAIDDPRFSIILVELDEICEFDILEP